MRGPVNRKIRRFQRDLDPLMEHLTYRRQRRDWITDCMNNFGQPPP
jgi:hypothetical protein